MREAPDRIWAWDSSHHPEGGKLWTEKAMPSIFANVAEYARADLLAAKDAEIAALQAEVGRLREALEPFGAV